MQRHDGRPGLGASSRAIFTLRWKLWHDRAGNAVRGDDVRLRGGEFRKQCRQELARNSEAGILTRPLPQWYSDAKRDRMNPRSEEHTSELQSQSNLVCRLL